MLPPASTIPTSANSFPELGPQAEIVPQKLVQPAAQNTQRIRRFSIDLYFLPFLLFRRLDLLAARFQIKARFQREARFQRQMDRLSFFPFTT